MKAWDVVRFWILALVFLLGAIATSAWAQCPGGKCGLQKGWAWAMTAAATLERQKAPAPAPQPKPDSQVCHNCKGSGKVGDGVVFTVCQECGGTGKKTPKAPSPQMPALTGPGAPVCSDGRCSFPVSTFKQVYTPAYNQPTPYRSLRKSWLWRSRR